MARNEIDVDVPPERVFEVLVDARVYADWVVGAKEVREIDDDWPAVGAAFHHRVGVGPLTLRDNTKVVGLDPPRRLVLEARARPAGVARVELTLTAVGEGTHVVMDEVATGGPAARLPRFVNDPLIHGRNIKSLRRLKALAERPPGSSA